MFMLMMLKMIIIIVQSLLTMVYLIMNHLKLQMESYERVQLLMIIVSRKVKFD